MNTASVMFDYYSRDSKLPYIRWIGFQSAPPYEGEGQTCLGMGLSEHGASICKHHLNCLLARSLASAMVDITCGAVHLEKMELVV